MKPIDENEYLERLEKIINQQVEDRTMPETAPAVATLLTKFRPADPDSEHQRLYSLDVVELLEDICSITLNDVTTILQYLGFRLTCSKTDFTVYWAIAPVDGVDWDDPDED